MERKKGIMLSYNAPDRGYIWLDPAKNVLKNCVKGVWNPIGDGASDQKIEEIIAEQERLIRLFGDLAMLKTVDKNNIVSAVNEVYDKITKAPVDGKAYVWKNGGWVNLSNLLASETNIGTFYKYSQTKPPIGPIPQLHIIDFTDESNYQEDGYITNDGFGRGTGYFEGINFQTSSNGSFKYHKIHNLQGLFNLGSGQRTLEIFCKTSGNLVIDGNKLDEGIIVRGGIVVQKSSKQLKIIPQYDRTYVYLDVPRGSLDSYQYITTVTTVVARNALEYYANNDWVTSISYQRDVPLWMSFYCKTGSREIIGQATLIHQGVAEAPKDNNQYVRKNGEWTKVQGGQTKEKVRIEDIDAAVIAGNYLVDFGESPFLSEGILDIFYDLQHQYCYQRLTSKLTDPNTSYAALNQTLPATVWERYLGPTGSWSGWYKVQDGLVVEAPQDGGFYVRRLHLWVNIIGYVPDLQTESKTLVGAINEIYNLIKNTK